MSRPAVLLLLLNGSHGFATGAGAPPAPEFGLAAAGLPVAEAGHPSPDADSHGHVPVYRIHSPVGENAVVPERVRLATERLERRQARILELLGSGGDGADFPPVDVYLYPTVEAKALATGDMSVAHARPPTGEVHLSVQERLEGDVVAMEAAVLAYRHLGTPAARALERGLVVHLTGTWLGASPAHWVGRLHRARLVPPLGELLDDEAFDAGSRLALPAVAAALVEWLIARETVAGFRELYGGWDPSPEELEGLQPQWEERLELLAAASRKGAGTPPGPLPPPEDFRRGFNFAHEGYRIYNGYGSRQAARSLEELAELGTDAVAVLPYTFVRDPTRPAPFRISSRAGSENDVAVLHSVLSARELGMRILLKPHIWLRGSWPGEIRMGSEENWDRFFAEYGRWIGHYALMAEAYRMESFCVGVEMSAAALEQPDRWRALIGRLREIYTGELGYCANWGEEAENVEFWDAVDFVGVSAYYPVSSRRNPSATELLAGAREVVAELESLGRRHERPVLLTEAGFASSPQPWRRPWEEERGPGARVDLEAQARSYRALIQALEEGEVIRGVYWWKWPTTGPGDPLKHAGFTPRGKPAEAEVAEWFLEF